jgi:hypothetical protein
MMRLPVKLVGGFCDSLAEIYIVGMNLRRSSSSSSNIGRLLGWLP